MTKPNDQQLDDWLHQADEALRTNGINPISFLEVRRRAERIQATKLARRKSLSGLAVVGLLLGGWIGLAPQNNNDNWPISASKTFDLKSIQDELATSQHHQQQVDAQLTALRLERRVDRLQMRVQRANGEHPSPELAYLRNRDSRVALEQIVYDRDERLSSSDLTKLEVLVTGFPETKAGNEARALIAKHSTQL